MSIAHDDQDFDDEYYAPEKYGFGHDEDFNWRHERTLWDEDFYNQLSLAAEQDAADEWHDLFEEQVRIGVLNRHEDSQISIHELRRIAGYLR